MVEIRSFFEKPCCVSERIEQEGLEMEDFHCSGITVFRLKTARKRNTF